MNIEATAATPAPQIPKPALAGANDAPLSFVDWMQKQALSTNEKILSADKMVQRLALGETDNLHQVMIALGEAKLSFQLMVQVRNKLLEAYQDVLRMQV